MKIALLGYGTVGRGVDQIIAERVEGVEVTRILELPDRLSDPRMTASFDDILADALELGPPRSTTILLPPDLEQRLADSFPSAKPEVLLTLLEYYVANKQEGSPWVVLPVANFDAYFGTTAFSKKWLTKIPSVFMERQNQHFGVCRYRVKEEWVEGVSFLPRRHICRRKREKPCAS